MNKKDNNYFLEKEDILFNLEQGLRAENRALGMCKDLMDLLSDKEDKEKISKIILDEENHIKITEKLIKDANHYYRKS